MSAKRSKKPNPLLTEWIKSRFRYDPESGVVVGPRGGRGNKDKDGYLFFFITQTKKTYSAHRIAWLITTSQWPKKELDHINGVGSDNRWSNLREATRQQNSRNRKIHKNNKSGIKGVYWDKSNKTWIAEVAVRGKNIRFGRFKTKEEASKAYEQGALKHFGEFMRRQSEIRELPLGTCPFPLCKLVS